MRRLAAALGIAVALALPAQAPATQPDEILADPVQEERARELSKGLRCLVCRNESIDESNAGLARDLRLLVRERIVAGDSDEEVIDFVVDRYGEYVLLNPPATGSTVILWIAGPVMLLIAAGIGYGYQRRLRRRGELAVAELDPEEAERLREILGKPDMTERSG